MARRKKAQPAFEVEEPTEETSGTPETFADEPAVEIADPDDAPGAEAASPIPAEPDPVEVPEADEFPADLLSLAESYGFSADDAKEFGSEKLLRKAVAAQERAAAQWGRAQFESQFHPETNGHVQEQPVELSKPAAQKAPTPSSFEKFKLELSTDEYPAETVKTFSAMNDHYDRVAREQDALLKSQQDALLAMQDRFSQITGQSQAEEARRETEELEAFFTSLGDEYEDVFGKGSIVNFNPNSPQVRARQEMWQEMRSLQLSDAQNPYRKNLSDTNRLQRALAYLHQDKIKQTARKEVSAKLAERQSQSLMRPAGRQAPLSPRERAIQVAIDGAKKLGLGDHDAYDYAEELEV